jgi:hypothetical protein
MKIYELLLEYRRDVTQQKLAKELAVIADNENTTPEDVLEQVEQIDPTKNKQYVLWLVKQLVKQQFRLEDAPRVTELLNNFIAVKNRLPVEQRDIGRFDFYKLDDLIDKTMNVELEKATATSNGTFPVVPGSKVLYNGPLGQLAIPETEEASCELGRGTKWCTAAEKNNMFDSYSQQGPLYVWRDKNGEKYQFHFEATQFMDSKDHPIDAKTIAYFRTKHPVTSKLFAKRESEILKSGGPQSLMRYARTVINGRWPDAEPVIMQDPMSADVYATEIIGGRWPEAEPVIMTRPMSAVAYASDVIKGRWPEAEPVIMAHPMSAVAYARDVIKGRWPEAEPTIKGSGDPARVYAKEVIGGRWPAAEASIMTDSYSAFMYATEVIGGRWPEAEPIIATHMTWWKRYTKLFPDAAAAPTVRPKPNPKSAK